MRTYYYAVIMQWHNIYHYQNSGVRQKCTTELVNRISLVTEFNVFTVVRAPDLTYPRTVSRNIQRYRKTIVVKFRTIL